MNQFDDRTRANLDVVLEKVCRFLPHGGDHAFREKIARKLIESARQGTTTLRGLTAIGREAVKEASLRQPAAARRWPVYFNRTPQT